MNRRPLRVEQALDLLPELDDLLPLRDALIGASRPDEERVWTGAAPYATLDSRLADATMLEAELPALVAKVQERVESVYRQLLVAMRAVEAGDPAAAAAALVAAGEVEEAAGRLQAAGRFYARAEEVGRAARDRRPQGLALRRLARTARSTGRLDQSLELYQRGFEIAEAQRDAEGMVVGCQGIGNVFVEQGRWAEAEDWYRRGLQWLPADRPSMLLWQLESNLSIATRRAGRLDESAEWLERAKRTVEWLGDRAGRVYVLNAEGLLWVARGDPGQGEAAYQEALRYAESPIETGRVLVNLAESLVLQRRSSDAEAVIRRLEQIAVTHGLLATLPYVYRGLGAVARLRRDEEGFIFYEQALALCREEGLPGFELALTQLEYGEFEAELGQEESARARLQEARESFTRLGTRPEAERAAAVLAALEMNGSTTKQRSNDE